MAVTQPAWPSRVPRSESVSDILLSLFFCVGGEEKRLQWNEIEEGREIDGEVSEKERKE